MNTWNSNVNITLASCIHVIYLCFKLCAHHSPFLLQQSTKCIGGYHCSIPILLVLVLLVHQIRKCRFPYSLTAFSKSFFSNTSLSICKSEMFSVPGSLYILPFLTEFSSEENLHQPTMHSVCLFELHCNNCAHIVHPTPCFTYLVVLKVSLHTAFHYPTAHCLLLLLWGNAMPIMSKCNLDERFISLLSNVRLVSKTATNDPLQMLSIPLLSS